MHSTIFHMIAREHFYMHISCCTMIKRESFKWQQFYDTDYNYLHYALYLQHALLCFICHVMRVGQITWQTKAAKLTGGKYVMSLHSSRSSSRLDRQPVNPGWKQENPQLTAMQTWNVFSQITIVIDLGWDCSTASDEKFSLKINSAQHQQQKFSKVSVTFSETDKLLKIWCYRDMLKDPVF